MSLSQAEIDKRKDRLIAILKKEGSYGKYMRLLKKGKHDKALAITEDIIDRYGQDLQEK